MSRVYLGISGTKPDPRAGVGLAYTGRVFRSAETPTHDTHGEAFRYVIGPFRTARAARIMLAIGCGNPHLRCVADAERLAPTLHNFGERSEVEGVRP